MKNIKIIESEAKYNIFKKKPSYVTPNVILIEDTYDIKYNQYIIPQNHDYSLDYFTIEAIENIDDLLLFYGNTYYESEEYKGTMFYSLDGTTWSEMSEAVSLSAGDKIMFKGAPEAIAGSAGQSIYINGENGDDEYTVNGKFNVEGNIMSLIYGDDFIGKTSFPLNFAYEFGSLFLNQSNLINAGNLILPVTTLHNGCYSDMFKGCTSLITAPELPATTLEYMCYWEMFSGCTSLNYIKCLATNISASDCLSYWVESVASSGTFVKNSSMNSWPTGDDGIPSDWTVQDA